jgi:hypothetical protein
MIQWEDNGLIAIIKGTHYKLSVPYDLVTARIITW